MFLRIKINKRERFYNSNRFVKFREGVFMKIVEVADKVIIDGLEFYGHLVRKQFCSKCKFNLVYFEKFDAYFCPKCNSWTEPTCSDPSCKYCAKRPQSPLPNK